MSPAMKLFQTLNVGLYISNVLKALCVNLDEKLGMLELNHFWALIDSLIVFDTLLLLNPHSHLCWQRILFSWIKISLETIGNFHVHSLSLLVLLYSWIISSCYYFFVSSISEVSSLNWNSIFEWRIILTIVPSPLLTLILFYRYILCPLSRCLSHDQLTVFSLFLRRLGFV